MATRVPRPDSVMVGHMPFTIGWMDHNEWEAGNWEGDKSGTMIASRCLILIRLESDAPESMYQEVLLHELLHAVFEVSGMSYVEGWGKDNGSHSEQEEQIVLRMSPPLLTLLKNNPHVAKYLLSDGNHRR